MNRIEKIEEVVLWAKDNELIITFIGDEEDRHLYADAILGVTMSPHPAIVYSRSGVIQALAEMGDGDWESAVEWYSYNTERALEYVSLEEGRPIIVEDIFFEV